MSEQAKFGGEKRRSIQLLKQTKVGADKRGASKSQRGQVRADSVEVDKC